MSLARYPRSRETGYSWLGKLPEHWLVRGLSGAFELIGSGTTPKSDNPVYYDDGTIPWVNTGDLNDGELTSCERHVTEEALADYTTLRLYPAGSVAIAMYGATIGKVALLRFPATVNQACCVFAGRSDFNPRFLFYTLLGLRAHIVSLAYGGGQPNISQETLRGLRVPLPPPAEQAAIAAFLDRETGKIDALVEEQRRLIDLLKEKRQSVISHAITKGLDAEAKMKPSGVEWLGCVPEHWQVRRLGAVFSEIAEPGDGDLPIFSVSIHHGVSDTELDDEELDRKVSRSDDRSKYKRVQPDDLVYNMMRAWQGGFGSVQAVGMVSPAYVVARPKTKLSTIYVEALLRTPKAVEEMRRRSRGITDFRLRLYWDEFKDMSVALPPLAEQNDITRVVTAAGAQADTLMAESRGLVDLLQERRSALISAAVTGKIDVRKGTADQEVAA